MYFIDFFWGVGGPVFLLGEERIRLSLSCSFWSRVTGSVDGNDAYLHMYIDASWGQLFKANQTYQLTVGVTKELPATEGFKLLEMRITITRRDHANTRGNCLKQPSDGLLPVLARENHVKPFKAAVFCHFFQCWPNAPSHCIHTVCSLRTFLSIVESGNILWKGGILLILYQQNTRVSCLALCLKFVGGRNSNQIPWKFPSF